MKVFGTKEFESKLEQIDEKSKNDIYEFIDNISNFDKVEYILRLSKKTNDVYLFNVSNFIIFFSYTNDKVVMYDLVQRTSTDQEVAKDVLIRHIERSRDAQNVKVLENSDDESNWIFKISFQSKKGYEEGKWGINKETGMVTNQLDKELMKIILNVYEHLDFSEYSIANSELRSTINKLKIDHNDITGFITATYGRYYENIIEILTDKSVEELCEENYKEYKIIKLPDNKEIYSGKLNCAKSSGFIDPSDKV